MRSLEKANELVEKYIRYTPVEFEDEYAIKCAIIAVDEIISVTREDPYPRKKTHMDKQYWQEVKQHLKGMI